MTKVVVKSLKSKPKRARSKKSTVTETRVRDADGHVKTLHKLDLRSRTFGNDLEYVFGKNVAKARRENKRVIGTADAVVAKR